MRYMRSGTRNGAGARVQILFFVARKKGIEGFEKFTPLAAEAASPVGKWGNRLDVRSNSKVSDSGELLRGDGLDDLGGQFDGGEAVFGGDFGQ